MFRKIFRKIKNLAGLCDSPEGVLILMYHRVNDNLPAHNLVTRAKAFAEQMRSSIRAPQRLPGDQSQGIRDRASGDIRARAQDKGHHHLR